MQKQKTLAKWLAIILLCSVAVGSYVLYDALYLKKDNNQATADGGQGDTSDTNNDVDEYIPYYTTLPRQPEKIDSVTVTHFGGESDDILHQVINAYGKRYAIFTSNSVEFDMREKGLSVAVIGNSVERVVNIKTTCEYIDGKPSSTGIALLTKTDTDCGLIFINHNGDITAQISLPYFSCGKLYLSGQNLLLFATVNGYLTSFKINDNLTLSQSPFVIRTDVDNVVTIFDIDGGQGIICGDNSSTAIFNFNQNKGFIRQFQEDKLCFKQIITAGTSADCNYIIYGKLKGQPHLYAFDNSFCMLEAKPVDEVDDGVIFPYVDGFIFVGNGLTKSYCKHLDEVMSTANDLHFENVTNLTYGNRSIFAVVENVFGKILVYADGDVLLSKSFDCKGEIVGLVCEKNTFSLHLSTTSTSSLFRGNFGATDSYILDFSLSYFTSSYEQE